MILWYGALLIGVALLAAILCLVRGLRGRAPNDYTMGATALVGILLLVQIVVSIVQPVVGNHAAGDSLEFWMYLVLATFLPFGAGFWALIDRTRWSNIVLAIVHVSVAVMTYRMFVIWA